MSAPPPVLEPRPGLAGWLDRFVGPGATRAELGLQFGFAALCGAALALHARSLGWSGFQIALGAAIAFDVSGGIATCSTAAGRRWFDHKFRSARSRFAVASSHLVHVLLVAWFLRGGDWAFAGAFGGYLAAGIALVVLAPLYLQRPVAAILVAGAVLLDRYLLPARPGLEWFVPFLSLKALLAMLPR